MSIEILESILMEEDVVSSIEDNFLVITGIIPELKNMVGFEHKHPHHHLDVWNHTLLALSRSPLDLEIRLVLLLHDIGKPFSYQEGEVRHFKGHPYVSSVISKDILKRLNCSDKKIEEMCELIKVHDDIISEEDIILNNEFSKKRFKVQFCDALAHNPTKLEKRIKYLLDINSKLNDGEEKEKYNHILNDLIVNIEENKRK